MAAGAGSRTKCARKKQMGNACPSGGSRLGWPRAARLSEHQRHDRVSFALRRLPSLGTRLATAVAGRRCLVHLQVEDVAGGKKIDKAYGRQGFRKYIGQGPQRAAAGDANSRSAQHAMLAARRLLRARPVRSLGTGGRVAFSYKREVSLPTERRRGRVGTRNGRNGTARGGLVCFILIRQ